MITATQEWGQSLNLSPSNRPHTAKEAGIRILSVKGPGGDMITLLATGF